jgi:lysine-N-methylase
MTRFVPLPILEKWDCHTCGACCKGHTILLDDEDLDRLKQQGWESRPEFVGTPIVKKLTFFGSQRVLNQRPDGSCLFLTDDKRCRIHAEFGEPAKPWACRMFPYQVSPVGDEFRVTMRRTCPSAAADRGRSLQEHLPFIKELAPKAIGDGEFPPPPIHGAHHRGWPETRRLTDVLESVLLSERGPLLRRLWVALRIVDLVAEGRPRRLDERQWRELIGLFVQQAEAEVGDRLRSRHEPLRAAKLVFRQAAAEYLRFHPNMGDRPSLRQRWTLFRAAISIARGKGDVPAIHPSLPKATFGDLERPLGPLPEDVMRPLDRYFMAITAGLQYCGAGRRGWSVVDGFRALALAYPVAMWALRWISVGRTPTVEDAVQTVVMLDRSHYYPLLLGYRHRKRLDVLSQLGELDRLMLWYAR